MLRPSPNHGKQRLPNDYDDDEYCLQLFIEGICLFFRPLCRWSLDHFQYLDRCHYVVKIQKDKCSPARAVQTPAALAKLKTIWKQYCLERQELTPVVNKTRLLPSLVMTLLYFVTLVKVRGHALTEKLTIRGESNRDAGDRPTWYV